MADEGTPTPAAAEAEATAPATGTGTEEIAGAEALGDPGKQALDRMKSERDEARRLAKAHERELAEFRKSSMSEAERAVAEAEERGRMSAVTAYGERLARTEWIAEAARRNPGYPAADALEDLNVLKFIGEDGEPNAKAIAASVARLVPEASNGTPPPPSFDGGTRQPAPVGADMNTFIRKATGRA